MRASRGYERVEEDKTAGCMADGLHCNIWVRVQSPAKLSYELVKRGNCRGRKKGFHMHELAWNEGVPLPIPWWREDHPILKSSERRSYTLSSIFTWTGFKAFSYPLPMAGTISLTLHIFSVSSTDWRQFKKFIQRCRSTVLSR